MEVPHLEDLLKIGVYFDPNFDFLPRKISAGLVTTQVPMQILASISLVKCVLHVLYIQLKKTLMATSKMKTTF